MTESIVSTPSPREQPTDAQRVFSDKTHTCPPGLPYAEVDILGRAADHDIAGGALLAAMVRHAASDRQDRGELPEAEAEAVVDAALEQERRLLAELSSPGAGPGRRGGQAGLRLALRLVGQPRQQRDLRRVRAGAGRLGAVGRDPDARGRGAAPLQDPGARVAREGVASLPDYLQRL